MKKIVLRPRSQNSDNHKSQIFKAWLFLLQNHVLIILVIELEKYIKYLVGTQLYIITQISTYNYMFRPCILAIVRLYYKLNK